MKSELTEDDLRKIKAWYNVDPATKFTPKGLYNLIFGIRNDSETNRKILTLFMNNLRDE